MKRDETTGHKRSHFNAFLFLKCEYEIVIVNNIICDNV